MFEHFMFAPEFFLQCFTLCKLLRMRSKHFQTVSQSLKTFTCIRNSVFSAYELVVTVFSLSFWNAKPKIENSATAWLLDLCLSHWLHYMWKKNIELIAPFLLEPLAFFKDPMQTTPPLSEPNPQSSQSFLHTWCLHRSRVAGVVLESTVSQRNQDMKRSSKKLGPSNPSTPEITIVYIITLPFEYFW